MNPYNLIVMRRWHVLLPLVMQKSSMEMDKGKKKVTSSHRLRSELICRTYVSLQGRQI